MVGMVALALQAGTFWMTRTLAQLLQLANAGSLIQECLEAY